MLSSKAADAISNRLYALCARDLSIDNVLKLDVTTLKGIGLSVYKAQYIMTVAEFTKNNPSFFDELCNLPDEEVIARLTQIRGIGPWSAKMYLIFCLNRLDVLPYEDGAFLQAYRWLYGADELKPTAIKTTCASWAPYASLAARYLYRALDEGITQDVAFTEKLRGCD